MDRVIILRIKINFLEKGPINRALPGEVLLIVSYLKSLVVSFHTKGITSEISKSKNHENSIFYASYFISMLCNKLWADDYC